MAHNNWREQDGFVRRQEELRREWTAIVAQFADSRQDVSPPWQMHSKRGSHQRKTLIRGVFWLTNKTDRVAEPNETVANRPHSLGRLSNWVKVTNRNTFAWG